MYLSFGSRHAMHFLMDSFDGFGCVLLTDISGRSEKREIPAATNMIEENCHSSFQKSRRTRSEPMIAPLVSMAWWIPNERPLSFVVSIRIASLGASLTFPNLSNETKVTICVQDVDIARSIRKMIESV